jgi:hypothetical protein
MSCPTSLPSLNPNANILDQSSYLKNKRTITRLFEPLNTTTNVKTRNCCNRFTNNGNPVTVNVMNTSNITFSQSDYLNNKRFFVEMRARQSSISAIEKTQTLSCCRGNLAQPVTVSQTAIFRNRLDII